jgi:hypothetical protein
MADMTLDKNKANSKEGAKAFAITTLAMVLYLAASYYIVSNRIIAEPAQGIAKSGSEALITAINKRDTKHIDSVVLGQGELEHMISKEADLREFGFNGYEFHSDVEELGDEGSQQAFEMKRVVISGNLFDEDLPEIPFHSEEATVKVSDGSKEKIITLHTTWVHLNNAEYLASYQWVGQ